MVQCKRTGFSSRGPRFDSQDPHGDKPIYLQFQGILFSLHQRQAIEARIRTYYVMCGLDRCQATTPTYMLCSVCVVLTVGQKDGSAAKGVCTKAEPVSGTHTVE